MNFKNAYFAVLLAFTLGCERPADSKTPPFSAAPVTAQAAVPSLDIRWKGVCLAHSWEDDGVRGYGSDSSAEAISHLVSTGANSISITPFGFMSALEANRVRGEHDGRARTAAETRDRLIGVTRQAHQAGLEVVLKPHIWIRGGAWRGEIQPLDETGALDWTGWWQSYRQFVLYYARLAEELDIEGLVIGVELASALAHDPAPLLEVIEAARGVYDGHVSYAANWNEEVPDRIWRDLDSVGVQFYPPISQDMETTEAEMRKNLRERLDEWSSVAARVDKPLVLTEVGYRSANSAARYPFAWPEKSHETFSKPDPALQRMAYRALFFELADTPRLEGVFIWKYFTNRHTDEEGADGFSPRGKPAESVLLDAF